MKWSVSENPCTSASAVLTVLTVLGPLGKKYGFLLFAAPVFTIQSFFCISNREQPKRTRRRATIWASSRPNSQNSAVS